jgi:creatinine amidohydrolase
MKLIVFSILIFFSTVLLYSQATTVKSSGLPAKWEELTSPDFVKALTDAGGVCIIPMGIIEKHGPHLPLGTDLLDVREVCARAVQQEYALVFPQFYFGQIFEAQHQPGTMAYSPDLVWNVLQETCDQLGRNGITKIILVNGHGGNDNLIPYFCQAQLAKQKNYAVYLFSPEDSDEFMEKVSKLRKTNTGGHADEKETSTMLAHRPDLVYIDRAGLQSGADLNRLNLPYTYTGIWWYAKYPNHYAGDGRYASKELGNLLLDNEAGQLVEMIRAIKADKTVIELQNEFYEKTANPLGTKQ